MGATIESIIDSAKEYLPSLNIERVKKAYAFADRVHEGQVRFSGDPYITHPLESTSLLLPMKPDEDAIIATLLHDVPDDTNVPLKDIEKAFGASVARLVQGTEKLSLVRVNGGESQVENWRKMFLAMAKDLRVVFIKLAERLHNMQTLEYVAKSKQQRIAEETLQVYAPIAARLGIYSVKSELEDLCFKYLHPQEYDYLCEQIEAHGRINQQYIEEAQDVLQKMLERGGIEASVKGRIKHIYSIYRKLKKKNTNSLRDIYDLFAMRIVLPDQYRDGREFLGHCYTTLGAIHNRWTPMPGRFKDYIAVPKLNGYRSLHTTVTGVFQDLERHPIEIQVRTESMHQESEYGIASHWWYKDNDRSSKHLSRDEVQGMLKERRLLTKFYDFLAKYPEHRSDFEKVVSAGGEKVSYSLNSSLEEFLVTDGGFSYSDVHDLVRALNSEKKEGAARFFQHQIDWLYGLEFLRDEEGLQDPESRLANIFDDRIFVLTPHGDVKDLPAGSTPVDFAYAVHSDVGNSCFQAKVNGAIVRLDSELKSGDIIEIVTRKHPNPSRYWLSFVKTNQAKTKIKMWFRAQDREKNIKAGRDLLNNEFKRLNKPSLGPNYRALSHYGGKKLSLSERENVVESVGNGTLSLGTVVRTLFSEEELLGERMKRRVTHTAAIVEKPKRKGVTDEILITGVEEMPITLSSCCKPRFPVDIVGHVSRGQTIRVHRAACRELREIDPNRLLDASWAAKKAEPQYQVRLHVEAYDQVGLLRDIVAAVADLGMNIVDFPLVSKKRGTVTRNLIVELPSYDMLAKLMYRLETTPGVKAVAKV